MNGVQLRGDRIWVRTRRGTTRRFVVVQSVDCRRTASILNTSGLLGSMKITSNTKQQAGQGKIAESRTARLTGGKVVVERLGRSLHHFGTLLKEYESTAG